MRRIWAIAHNAFREVIRDRILYLILLFLIVVVSASVILPQLANQAQAKILLDIGLAAIYLIGLLVAIFVGTGLVNKEIEKRTVYVLIAKPISRAEFIVGKHFGLVAVLSVLLVGMTVIFGLVLALQGSDPPLGSIAWAICFSLLELVVIVAASLMFGVFTSSTLAMVYTISLILVGHFSRSLLQLGKILDNAFLSRIFEALYIILPDLERLNLRNQAVYGQLPATSELLFNGVYGIVYTVLLLAITVFVFARRQF